MTATAADRDASREFACDLCGETRSLEVPHSREFHGGVPIDICWNCGFVYVRRRRSAQRIAEVWSSEIFGHGYTAAIPAVAARLTYVAELLDSWIGLSGKAVLEIGAGEGHFLRLVAGDRYGARVFGVEPSTANGALLAAAGIEHFTGTIEDYVADGRAAARPVDVVAILWTLENCQDCKAMLAAARSALKPDGHVVVATGSRILVPFKKPLHTYFSSNPADTHAFRFSANTLTGALAVSGFEVAHVNRYLDHDVLCMVGKKSDHSTPVAWTGDSPAAVHTFFERWYVDTKMYFPDPL
jgi:SAM-dependent methyltransferase